MLDLRASNTLLTVHAPRVRLVLQMGLCATLEAATERNGFLQSLIMLCILFIVSYTTSCASLASLQLL